MLNCYVEDCRDYVGPPPHVSSAGICGRVEKELPICVSRKKITVQDGLDTALEIMVPYCAFYQSSEGSQGSIRSKK